MLFWVLHQSGLSGARDFSFRQETFLEAIGENEINKQLISPRGQKNGRGEDIFSVAPTRKINATLINIGVNFRALCSFFFLNSRQGQYFSKSCLSSPNCILPVIFLFWSLPRSRGLLPTFCHPQEMTDCQTALSLLFPAYKEYMLFTKKTT